MNRSDSIKSLADALVKAQSQIKGAVKDSENPHFRSKYADLASVWDACRDALTGNGIAVVQAPRAIDGGVEVETMLLHSSGEFISESLAIPVQKQDAQGFGSALTYCRRYGLASMVGVAPEDDDGNAASTAKPAKGEFKPITARGGAYDSLTQEQKTEVDRLAGLVIDALDDGNEQLAYDNFLSGQKSLRGQSEMQVGYYDRFNSVQRTLFKKYKEANMLATQA